MTGKVVAVLTQMLETLPVVGAMQAHFINLPEIQMNLTGAAAMAQLPGLSSTLHKAIDTAVASVMVLPNRLSLPLVWPGESGHDTCDALHIKPLTAFSTDDLDMAELRCPPPLGVLKARPVSASRIRAADHYLLADSSSDPYVQLKLANVNWRSSTVYKSLSPIWGPEEYVWLQVQDLTQHLDVSIWDEDRLSADDLVGLAKPATLFDLLGMEGKNEGLKDGGFAATSSMREEDCTVRMGLHPKGPTRGADWPPEPAGGELLLDLDWRPVLLSNPSADAKGHVNGVRCLVAVKVKWVRATVAEGAAARVCARLPEGVHCVTQPARVPQAPFGFLEDTFERVRTAPPLSTTTLVAHRLEHDAACTGGFQPFVKAGL